MAGVFLITSSHKLALITDTIEEVKQGTYEAQWMPGPTLRKLMSLS